MVLNKSTNSTANEKVKTFVKFIVIFVLFLYQASPTYVHAAELRFADIDSQTREALEAATAKSEDLLAYIGFSIMRLLGVSDNNLITNYGQSASSSQNEKNNVKQAKIILNIKPVLENEQIVEVDRQEKYQILNNTQKYDQVVNIKSKSVRPIFSVAVNSVENGYTRNNDIGSPEIPDQSWIPIALRTLAEEYSQKLSDLQQKYDNEINALKSKGAYDVQRVVVRNDNVSLSQRIDRLYGVNLINPIIQGGSANFDSLEVNDVNIVDSLYLIGSFLDTNNSAGLDGQILTSTGTSTQWVSPDSISLGSIGQHYDVDVSSIPPSVGQVLSWDGTNWVPATSTAPNIYTADGALNSDRTVTLGSYSLAFGNKLFIDGADTQVGIGTSNPNATLTVSDNGTVYDFYTNTVGGGGPEFEMTGPADQQTSFAFRYQGNGSASIRFTKYADTQKNWAIGIQDNDNAFRIKQGWGGSTLLSSYQNEYLTILQDGNIGISNPNPTAKLDINGTLNVSGTSTLATSTVVGNFEVGNTALFVDASNKKVSVATSTGSQALTVNGSIDVLGTSTLLYKDGLEIFRFGSSSQSLAVGTNISDIDTHNYSTFVGADAASYLQNGATSNTAVGYGTLRYAQSFNTAVGYNAVRGGSFNTGIGVNAYTSGSGTYNTALGVSALRASYGSYNTALGAEALGDLRNGNDNIAIGYRAAKFISDGSTFNQNSNQSIYIGNDVKAGADNTDNEIVIGYGATGLGSNTVLIGNDNILTTVLKGKVGIGTDSPVTQLDVQDNGTGTVQVIRMRAPNATYAQYSLGASDSEKIDVVWDNNIKQGRLNTFNTQHTLAFNNGVLFVSANAGTKGIGVNVGVTPSLVGPLDVRSSTGVNILSALDSGNIGIGTANPLAKLHVENGEAWVFNDGNSPRIILGDNTTTGQYGWLQWDSTNDYFRIDTSSSSATGLKLKDNTLAIGNVFPDTSKLFIAADDTSTRMVINKTGEVGIGTDVPDQKLQVDGGRIKIVNSGDLSSAGVNSGLEMGHFTGNYGYVQTYNSTPLRINPLGNNVLLNPLGLGSVGIGTTSPSAKLSVDGGVLSVNNSGTSVRGSGVGIEIGSLTTFGYLQTYQSKPMQINPLGNNLILNPNSGSIGVGTENPLSKLHVVTVSGESNVILERNEDSTVGAALTYQRSRGTETAKTALQSGDVIGGFNSFGHDGSIYQRSASVRTFVDGAVSSGIVPGRIVFETMDSTGAIAERIRITNSGNMGIGTTSPSQKLDVAGNIRIQGALFDSQNLQGSQGQVLTVNSVGNVEWQNPVSCVLGGASILSDGTVNSSYGIISGVTRTNTGRYTINFSITLTTGQYYAHLTKTETTATRDDVNIDVSSYGTTSMDVIIHEGDNGTSANVYRDRDFSVTLFDSNCTALSPLANSDKRLKTDIRSIDSRDALQKVLHLQGVKYKWNTEKYPYRRVAGFDDNPEIGLIAQDVKEVVPEVVDKAGDGYYVLDYEKLVAILIESTKAIWFEITGLKEKVQEIDMLKAELCKKDSSYSWCVGYQTDNINSGSDISNTPEISSNTNELESAISDIESDSNEILYESSVNTQEEGISTDQSGAEELPESREELNSDMENNDEDNLSEDEGPEDDNSLGYDMPESDGLPGDISDETGDEYSEGISETPNEPSELDSEEISQSGEAVISEEVTNDTVDDSATNDLEQSVSVVNPVSSVESDNVTTDQDLEENAAQDINSATTEIAVDEIVSDQESIIESNNDSDSESAQLTTDNTSNNPD